MLIGVISDTHSQKDKIKKALQIFKERGITMIIHAGDLDLAEILDEFKDINLPIKMAIGNMDEEPILYPERAKRLGLNFEINSFLNVQADRRIIFVFHGKVLGSLEQMIETMSNTRKYDAIIYGHTHRARNEYKNNILILNPGSLQPIELGVKESVAVYDTETNKAEVIEI